MKIIVTADTHGGHAQLGVLSGDVLIHCGDVENMFAPDDSAVDNVDDWFATHDVDHVLCIGGNHDRDQTGEWRRV